MRIPLSIAVACAVANAHAAEVDFNVVLANGFEVATPTAFRMGALALRDPHLFFPFAGFCIDSTEALNQEIALQLDADENSDGFYDTSPLALFRPFATGLPVVFENRSGICESSATPHCTPGVDAPVQRWVRAFDLSPPMVCAGPLPDTVSGFNPPVPSPGGNCFATTMIDTVFPLSTLELPLWDTKFAAPWPSTSGSTGGGLVRGFLRESDADQISIDLGTGRWSCRRCSPTVPAAAQPAIPKAWTSTAASPAGGCTLNSASTRCRRVAFEPRNRLVS